MSCRDKGPWHCADMENVDQPAYLCGQIKDLELHFIDNLRVRSDL